MKEILLASLIIVFLFLSVTSSYAGSHGWLIYYDGAYRGKVIDSETREEIEGAVVVAVYHVECLGFGHGGSVSVDVKETLTDKKGEFHIRPNISFNIVPWCLGSDTTFIIFKPGYAAIDGLSLEDTLSRRKTKEDEVPWMYNKDLKFLFGPGIIGLPELRTREERLEALTSVPIAGIPSRKMQNLLRLFNEEAVSLGLKPISLP